MSDVGRNLEKYGIDYEQLPFESYQVFFRRRNLIEQLQKRSHRNVLEIGCGQEPLFKYVNDVEKWVVVEPTKQFYLEAKKVADKNVVLINDFFENALEKIKETEIEFDYIICSCLLHELNNPEIILKAIHKLCGKNTIVNINVPNAKSIHRILAYCMGIIPDIYCKSQTQELMQQSDIVYDIDLLEKKCIENGFAVINSGSYFVKMFTHRQMQDCLDNKIFDINLLYGLDKLIEYMPEYGSEIFVECKMR